MLGFKNFRMLLENRIEFLKNLHKEIDTSHDGSAALAIVTHHFGRPADTPFLRDLNAANGREEKRKAATQPHHIIDYLADHDPHPKKANTQWMVNQYKKGNFMLEDAPRLKGDLERFSSPAIKSKLAVKDINQYKHPADLSAALRALRGKDETFPDGPRFEGHPGANKIFDDGKGTTVHHIATHEAGRAARDSCDHEDNTGGWCFGWAKPDHFKRYSKDGPIHVLQTPDNRKYGFHDASNQFKDKDDQEVHGRQFDDLLDKHPSLLDIKELHPIISSHISQGSKHADRLLSEPEPHINVLRNLVSSKSNHIDKILSNHFHRLDDHGLANSIATHGTDQQIDKLLDHPHLGDTVKNTLADRGGSGPNGPTIAHYNKLLAKHELDDQTAATVAAYGNDQHRTIIGDRPNNSDYVNWNLAKFGNTSHRETLINKVGLDRMSLGTRTQFAKRSSDTGHFPHLDKFMDAAEQNSDRDGESSIHQVLARHARYHDRLLWMQNTDRLALNTIYDEGTPSQQLNAIKHPNFSSNNGHMTVIERGDPEHIHALLDHHALETRNNDEIAQVGTDEHREKLLERPLSIDGLRHIAINSPHLRERVLAHPTLQNKNNFGLFVGRNRVISPNQILNHPMYKKALESGDTSFATDIHAHAFRVADNNTKQRLSNERFAEGKYYHHFLGPHSTAAIRSQVMGKFPLSRTAQRMIIYHGNDDQKTEVIKRHGKEWFEDSLPDSDVIDMVSSLRDGKNETHRSMMHELDRSTKQIYR